MPRSSGSSGPTTVRSTASRRARSMQAVDVAGVDRRGPDRSRNPGIAGRADHLADGGFARQLPHERVLTAAAADDEDFHREDT